MKSLLRYTVDRFLWLPLGGLMALVWANVAPEGYFSLAHRLAFWVNDVAMMVFFAVVVQEVIEEVMPGGALHGWRRWGLPVIAGLGTVAGAALVYLAWVHWQYETLLTAGWPAAAAVDVAVVYVLTRSLFGRHPALSFVLLLAITADVVGLGVVAVRQHLMQLDLGALSILAVGVGLAWTLRVLSVRSFWPYLLACGPLTWWGLYATGLHPALALTPIMPFITHTPRTLVLFEDRPHSAHCTRTHFEHVFLYPMHAVLFLFGLVNAGVLLSGYGTGTWAVLAATLVGKPLGLLAATIFGVTLGLRLPARLHARDLAVVSLITVGGFAFALFFATAVFPLGPALAELKLGVIASGIGVPAAFVAARALKVGRFARRNGGSRVRAEPGLRVHQQPQLSPR